MAKIFIDVGHGGHDPGALGRHSKEKDNVLKVALRMKTLLESNGHTVRLSRSTDVYLTLSERSRLANAWGADYFISLHNNAATSNATGFETFVYNGLVSGKSIGLQNAIHNAIIKDIGIRDRGKKRANFAVLRLSKMPAALIEYAFISNSNDERILINEVEKLAQLTVKGIVDYVGSDVTLSSPSPSPSKPSDSIKQLQQQLNQVGFQVGVTGIIDNSTTNAVMIFQRRTDLTVDGIAGALTKAKLEEVIARDSESNTKPSPTNPQEKEDDKLYNPGNSEILNSTLIVLRRLEAKGELAISETWRKKLLDGTLTNSEAIGLIFVAIERGLIVGK